MTAHDVSNEPRSRRALLAGLLGGAGVWAASLVSQAARALAAAGDPIRMGRLNKASSTATTLQTKTSAAAYQVTQIGGGAAVKGVATNGRSIMGVAGHDGTGVWAYSPDHYGVHAECPDGEAIYAHSNHTAITAISGTKGLDVMASKVGIHAWGGERAAEFEGPILLTGVQDMMIQGSAPAAPIGAVARFFARDDGSGKMQICVRFPTGAVQVIATEP